MRGHKARIQAEEYELSKNPDHSGWLPTLSPFRLCSFDEFVGPQHLGGPSLDREECVRPR
jgi:hypothetical protein